jgi:hypothetical protein
MKKHKDVIFDNVSPLFDKDPKKDREMCLLYAFKSQIDPKTMKTGSFRVHENDIAKFFEKMEKHLDRKEKKHLNT